MVVNVESNTWSTRRVVSQESTNYVARQMMCPHVAGIDTTMGNATKNAMMAVSLVFSYFFLQSFDVRSETISCPNVLLGFFERPHHGIMLCWEC